MLQVCGVSACLLYIATLAVTTVPGAFFIFFAISVFNSCAELMLGSYLMETAHKDMGNAGAVQAIAGGTRALGAISAALVTLAMYPCDSSAAPDSRKVLACTGLIAASNFAFAFFLPNTPGDFEEALNPIASFAKKTPSTTPLPLPIDDNFDSLDGEAQASTRVYEEPKSWVWPLILAVSTVVSFQAVLIWVSLKDLVPLHVFWWVLATLVVFSLAIVSLVANELLKYQRSSNINPDDASDLIWKYIVPAVFLFVINAAPSASENLYTYQFYLFYTSSPCRMTHLSLINSAASVLSFIIYGFACNRQRIRMIILLTSTMSLALGLLWLPLTSMSLSADDDYDPAAGSCVTFPKGFRLLPGCIDPFLYTAVVSFITSVSSMLAFTPSTVLATESTPLANKTMAYAVYLSLIDSGDSASGWITSSIVNHLGITYGDWSGLPDLIWISSVSQLAVLFLLVPCLTDKVVDSDSKENGRESTEQVETNHVQNECYSPLSSGIGITGADGLASPKSKDNGHR